MTAPAGWPAINQLPAPIGPGTAPTASVVSAQLNGTSGRHLTLECFCSVDADVILELLGPDGTWRVAETEAITAGTLDTLSWPVALGLFRVRVTAALLGWTGYVIARVV